MLADIRGRETVATHHRERRGPVAWLRRRLPFVSDPEPEVEVVRTSETGMMAREVEEFAILHDERQKMRNERSESGGDDAINVSQGASADSGDVSGVPASNTSDRMLM